MRIALRLVALIVLLLPVSLYAAPGDADAVTQQCGMPDVDKMVPGTGTGLHPNPQRVLSYQGIELHFDKDPKGWLFLSAEKGKKKDLTRSEVERLLPCFAKAMYAVETHEPLKIVEKPAAPPPTLSQRAAAFVNLWAPGLIAGGIILYLLPILIGFVRRPISFVRLVTINLLLGWTIVGWFIAMRMVFTERRRFSRSETDVWPPKKEERVTFHDALQTLPSAEQRRKEAREAGVRGDVTVIRPRHMEPEEETSQATHVAPFKPQPSQQQAPPLPSQQLVPPGAPPAETPIHRPSGERSPLARGSGERLAERSPSGERLVDRRNPTSRSSSAVRLPLAEEKTKTMGYSSTTPKLMVPASGIEWTEHFSPERRCRIEVVNDAREVTLYEFYMTSRGYDGDGKEYVGGNINKSFCVFHRDTVNQIVNLD